MKKFLLVLVVLLGISQLVFSQDKIYRKGGQTIKAKVLEIGIDEIKYKLFDEPDGPTYSIEKDRIVKVVYQTGRTEVYQNNLKDPELYVGQSTQALKLEFLSPLLGYTEFTYERGVSPGRSMEFSLGIIGLGKNTEIYYYGYFPGGSIEEYKRDAWGAFITAGYKFTKLPDFINRNIRYSHVLQGFYVKPNVSIGAFTDNIISEKNQQVVVDRRPVRFAAIMIDLGKQWVFSDKILLDLHWGFGYTADNIKYDGNVYSAVGDEYASYNFAVARVGRSPGLGVQGGIRIGLLFGGKKAEAAQ